MKAEKIDMKLSDKEIDNKLDQTLHTPLVKSLTDDLPNAHDSPCPHFICRKNCHYPRMQQLVKDLSWRLEEHKVEPASLLLFTVDSHSMPLILGVSMKKPITHIFVNGALDAEQVALTDAFGTIPQFQSSHQLMLELLRRHSPDPSDTLVVSVDVWACSAFIDPGGMLKSSPETLLCDFTISSEKKTKKKPVVVKLPFGLDQRLKDLRAKKRESQPRTKVQKKSKTKATKAGPLLKKSLPTESSSSSANSDSEFAEDPNEEEEQSAPMSKVVAAEEKTVQEVAQEVEDDDTQRAATADSAQATLSVQGQSKSFFARQLGLDSAGLASSGRSVCLHCKVKTPINSVRFCWYHSKLKPSAWCHSHCLVPLVKATGMRETTMPKLKEIAKKAQPNPHVFSAVAADARKILQILESGGA